MSLSGFMFRVMAGRSDKRRDSSLTAPEDVTAICDINYANNKDIYNTLDIYFPKDVTDTLPVIVSYHGGGYVYGTKEIYKYYGMFLAQQGFVFVNFNYHLAPKAKFPTQLTEANLVFQWIVANGSKYHMDLNNVFLVGDSAGAQMASQYAAIVTNPDYASLFPFQIPSGFTLRAIALNCGMYETNVSEVEKSNRFTKDLFHDYFGKNPTESYGKDFLKMIDVLGHITSDFPPTYVMTSEYDFLKENALPLHDFLKSKNIPCEYKCYGDPSKEYMGHVCHVNMNLEEAKEINLDECNFFRNYIM
ncbi:MAG: alpha/beta hydrolase [Lachnospiraceae bacterium]|nr:alpha/beta hydrolase [Lachnospiraceae bacterium]